MILFPKRVRDSVTPRRSSLLAIALRLRLDCHSAPHESVRFPLTVAREAAKGGEHEPHRSYARQPGAVRRGAFFWPAAPASARARRSGAREPDRAAGFRRALPRAAA